LATQNKYLEDAKNIENSTVIHLIYSTFNYKRNFTKRTLVYPFQTSFIMQLVKHTDAIFSIPNFLSEPLCQQFIELTENIGYEAALIQVGNGKQRLVKSVRNNQRVMLLNEPMAESLWESLAPFVPSYHGKCRAISLNEMLRFYKYDIGQSFKKHRDASYIRPNGEASFFTFLIYLNHDFDGGSTLFDNGVEVMPHTGSALIFEHQLRHQGSQVTKGTKYVLRSDIMYRFEG